MSHNCFDKRFSLAQNVEELPQVGDGEPLTKALNKLEQCGFIRKYKTYTKEKQGFYFQLIDPFMNFCFHFIKNREHESWISYLNTPSYFSWMGNAFELVCLLHVSQMKYCLKSISFLIQQKNSKRRLEIKKFCIILVKCKNALANNETLIYNGKMKNTFANIL